MTSVWQQCGCLTPHDCYVILADKQQQHSASHNLQPRFYRRIARACKQQSGLQPISRCKPVAGPANTGSALPTYHCPLLYTLRISFTAAPLHYDQSIQFSTTKGTAGLCLLFLTAMLANALHEPPTARVEMKKCLY